MAAHHRSDVFARYQYDLNGLLARPSEMTIFSVADVIKPVPSGRSTRVRRTDAGHRSIQA